MDRCNPAVRADVARRIDGKVNESAFDDLNITRLDCMQLGSMFSTEGIPGYGASVLRVVQDSVLHGVMARLLADPGFCAALSVEHSFSLEALPLMAGDVPGEMYMLNVPSDVVWATLIFIMKIWGKAYGMTFAMSVAHKTDAEYEEMLARFNYPQPDIDAILAARKKNPEGVDTVFDVIIRQSALFAATVKEHRTKLPADPDVPAPADPVESEPPQDAPPEPRRVPNDEIADEVCREITARRAHPDLCVGVRHTLDELTEKGMNISDMDRFTQSRFFESNVAGAVVFAYTLFGGPENNPYFARAIDALVVPETVSDEGCAGDCAAPADDRQPEQLPADANVE